MSRSLKVPVGYHYGNSPLMASDVFFFYNADPQGLPLFLVNRLRY